MLKDNVTLEDKYLFTQETIYLNGIQALVRLPLMQKKLDEQNGLDTAGFISGYRGSPLGGLDINLENASKYLKQSNIIFQPGLNEELGATAVWGSQQTNLNGTQKHDGVFGLWYGKGPGVDRAGDALKHANVAGTSKYGGVLALIGDDHSCKSSTFPHQSEHALIHMFMPLLNPCSIQDILDMGLFGIAMSRYCGLWVGFKCLADMMDSSATVYANQDYKFKTPTDFELPPEGLNIRWPDIPVEQEKRILKYKIPAAKAFARANKIDHLTFDSKTPKIAFVTTGKSYAELLQALRLLKFTKEELDRLGVLIYKVGMVWPLEDQGIKDIAQRVDEIFVVEEKRPLIEEQIKNILFNENKRPLITGKTDPQNKSLLPEHYELSPILIARALLKRLKEHGDVSKHMPFMDMLERADMLNNKQSPMLRIPYYCSGCPHNTSTRVPEGSRALAGIGCHYMATWIDDKTQTYSQMGGEGVAWIGQKDYVNEKHVFANLGDGTYEHSGLLAIRANIATNSNITYKILYNDAVAMTGGQHLENGLSVDMISRQVAAEGVSKIIVMSDDLEKYKTGHWDFAKNVEFRPRSEIITVQKELRETEGVSVLIYDQTCAAEKRRRRKRGLMHDPKKRVVINEAVCEGCGDCGKASNCVSILPVETEFGRKRKIDQSNCNKDYTCLDGFCPSFVTIEGTDLKKRKKGASKVATAEMLQTLPEPKKHDLSTGNWSVLLTGIGGTGVVTIGALLAMASHLEHKGGATMDQIGLAQKGGAVKTYMRFADKPEKIYTAKIGVAQADVIIGADMVVASSSDVLATMKENKTLCILNTNVTQPGQFTKTPDLEIPEHEMMSTIASCTGTDNIRTIDATHLATQLLGDSIATNLFMVGYTYQNGGIPLTEESILRAIELNNVAVEMNKQAFYWGRLAAHNPEMVHAHLLETPHTSVNEKPLDDLIQHRVQFLTNYQNKSYANNYKAFIDTINALDFDKEKRLTRAVAFSLSKLMAYKDEYEVARLFTQTDFKEKIDQQFEEGYKLKFHLAPPLFAKRDKDTGHLKKMEIGGWMLSLFQYLAKFKSLRGTKLDIFGYSAERKTERQLIQDYKNAVTTAIEHMNESNYETVLEIATLPEKIRGFGHVKHANIEIAKTREKELFDRLRQSTH